MSAKSYRRLAKDKPAPKIAAFDTETDGLNGTILCATYADYSGSGIITGLPNEIARDLLDYMISRRECIWFAHNAQYDWRYLIDEILNRYDEVDFLSRTESDIFEIRIYLFGRDYKGAGSTLTMRDSFALFSSSLAEFIKSYAPKYAKQAHDHTRTFDTSNPVHVRYAINDAVGLRAAMIGMYRSWHESFGCYPSSTIAGSAIKAWRATMGKTEVYHQLEDESFFRAAYFGGLVFLTDDNAHANPVTYDIASSYPSQMLKHGVPYGVPSAITRFDPGSPSFCRVIVTTPPGIVIPILPWRHPTTKQVHWPIGTFETTVTSFELEFALRHGYTLDKFVSGYEFPDIVRPFTKFVNKCKTLRETHRGTNKAIETNAKLAQNSCYGKFGSRRERTKIIMSEYAPDNSRPLFHPRLFAIEEQADILAMPHWAAWITARARIQLLTAAYDIGPIDVINGDTDSITVTSNADTSRLDIGTDYGQWKLDKTWIAMRATAPKQYAGMLTNGTIHGKVKGIPRSAVKKNPQILVDLMNGKKARCDYESVPNMVAIIKGNAITGSGTTNRVRTSSDIENSASWKRLGDGRIRPKRVPDIGSTYPQNIAV